MTATPYPLPEDLSAPVTADAQPNEPQPAGPGPAERQRRAALLAGAGRLPVTGCMQ